MLLSTSQIASFVGLKDENHKLEISNRQLERVSETRLLGAKFQENLKWNDHVKDIAKCFLWSLTHNIGDVKAELAPSWKGKGL